VNRLTALVFLVSGALASACFGASTSPIAAANAALQAGEADKTLSLLASLPPRDASLTHCRVDLMLESWDEAASQCEQAVRLDPQSSAAHLWLGRALGERASRASFLNAYSLAKRVRQEFEEAVRLDPTSLDALMDLGEFYYDAPGVVGGGIAKAQSVALQVDKLDSVRALELSGHIDQQRKDYAAAEAKFKQAVSASRHPAYQWLTLAGLYRTRERWAEMIASVHSVFTVGQHDPKTAPALYDAAAILIKTHREPEFAVKLLNAYLASPAKSEQAPAFVAHLRLARLLSELGDSTGAARERATSLALAHGYKPAQERKH